MSCSDSWCLKLVREISVSSFRDCLRKVLGRASLNFEEMCTVLAEVEAILNSRPLTFVHNEVDEPQPLTPAHFRLRPNAKQGGNDTQMEVQAEPCDQFLEQLAKRLLAGSKVSTPL